MRNSWRRLMGALVPALLLAASCGGGGGGGGGIGFSIDAISPAVSDDLVGGDTVTITGTNFLTALVGSVTFGGVPGTNRQILSETEMTVQTPPAPGGIPQAVTVVLTSVHGGTEQLVDGYTYAVSGPNPQTIAPTTFTPTGAEDFTITGTTLGPLGGQVTVLFAGIGSVTGNVSLDGQSITGRAPVSASVPPIGPLTVTVDTGAATADVPATVTYPYALPAPFAVGVPGQTLGNASQPVRLADGFAALSTAGIDGAWGTADDDIRIVHGPPNPILIRSVAPRGAAVGTPVGYLSPLNSIPAVLGPDTFCVFTVGAAATGPGFVLVTLARTAPVADILPHPGINAAPIAAIGPNRIGFMATGVDGVFGPAPANAGDDLLGLDFNLAFAPPAMTIAARVMLAGIADVTAGPGNFTIPFTADGDTVFVMGTGPDGVAKNGDDTYLAHVVSTVTSSPRLPAPFLLGRPIALSATLFAAPGAGPNTTFGNADDTLEVFSFAGAWVNTPRSLGQAVNNALAVVPYARIGNGIAVAVAAPSAIMVYTDPLAGTKTTLPFAGSPLFAPLGSGALVVFGPGGDLAVRTGDDDALHLSAATAAQSSFSFIPNQFQTIAPLCDGDRAFALAPGGDNVFGTNDDILEVYQSRALAEGTNASRLPVAALPAAQVLGLSVTFVPVGPGWGLVQTPGAFGVWGDGNDQLILVRY